MITTQSVEQALNAMRHGEGDDAGLKALRGLALVDAFLSDPTVPLTDQSREYALFNILSHLLTAALVQSRYVLGLAEQPYAADWRRPFKRDVTTSEQAQALIRQDARMQNAELIGWSCLYYRYVRADLGLAYHEIAAWMSMEKRVLRRRKADALAMLVDCLTDAEWAQRTIDRKRLLQVQIPVPQLPVFVGHQAARAQVQQILMQQTTPKLMITGASGVGKTTLAAVCLRDWLDAVDWDVDYVIWVQSPRSLDEVIAQLEQRVLTPHTKADLRAMLGALDVVVVLDDVTHFDNDWLRFLAPVTLIMTNSHYDLPDIFCVPLREWQRDDVQQYIRQTAELQDWQLDVPETTQRIWQAVGGHPAAVRLSLAQVRRGDFAVNPAHPLRDLYARIAAQLPEAARLLWQVLCLFPTRAVDLQAVAALDANLVQHIGVLLRHHVVDHHAGHYRLVSGADQIERDTASVGAWLNTVQMDDIAAALPLIEGILLSEWGDRHLLEATWETALDAGYAPHWRRIFERYLPEEDDINALHIGYVAILRRLGAYQAAQVLLRQIIAKTGQQGDFARQAEALLEFARLCHAQGRYAQALQQLDYLAKRAPTAAMHLDRARIAVEARDGVQARAHIEQAGDSLAARLLWGEVLLLEHAAEDAEAYARHILAEDQPDALHCAVLYTVIGRSYQMRQKYDAALEVFQLALTQFERVHHLQGVARARSNLGAVLAAMGEWDDAAQHLKQAQAQQKQIADQSGLFTTQHNLNYLDQSRVTT